ncbi:MAG: hypothetical protein WBW73_10515, partial [Rhodoplanes sp.]
TYDGPFQALGPGLLIRCVSFLGEHWNAHRFPGSNSPYWSLGFEVWYYVAFGAFVFCPGRWRWIAAATVLVFIGPWHKVATRQPAVRDARADRTGVRRHGNQLRERA